MPKIKLRVWAEKNGLSYITANRLFHANKLPNAQQLDTGTILVEDDSSEPTMVGNTSNEAMSLFLKKTVEYSKNNSTIEDFAAYIISNFNIKLNMSSEGPRYSRQKPKSEDVQKHFQQFIPKGEKPKPNSFVMEPDSLADLSAVTVSVDPDQLVQEFKQAVEGTPYPIDSSMGFSANAIAVTSSAMTGLTATMGAEGMVAQSVDFNSTPQQINYTGSNNLTFSSPLTYAPNPLAVNASSLLHGSTIHVGAINNSAYLSGIVDSAPDLESTTSAKLNQPRKRGRKPTKK